MFANASEQTYDGVMSALAPNIVVSILVDTLTSVWNIELLKINSMPKLELCGGQLSSKLLRVFNNAIDVSTADIEMHVWTDSTIVLL